jgi:hypothetical protein
MEEVKKIRGVRDYISPSDLTFLWSKCKRCFWLKYNKGVSAPVSMPLVKEMAAYQEKLYRYAPTREISPLLGNGIVTKWGEAVNSKPLVINGEPTRWRIKGMYDILVKFDDGRAGLIDCKVTAGDINQGKVDHYWPQLEAYAFALENPLIGPAHVVSETGLLIWKLVKAETDFELTFNFNSKMEYLSVGRNSELFNLFIEEVINLLEGEIPESAEKCAMCKYVEKRNHLA